MTWSKEESQLDAQLAELFQKDMAMPAPVVQTQTLERMRRQREQNGLLGSGECAIFFVVCSVFADRGAVIGAGLAVGRQGAAVCIGQCVQRRFAGCCAAVDRAAKTEDTFDAVVERM